MALKTQGYALMTKGRSADSSKHRRAAALLTVVAVIACSHLEVAYTADDAGFTRLSGPQIRAKFSGMRLTDEVHWGEVYERNGVLASTSMGKKRLGTWKVNDDELCTEMEKGEDANCYEVWMRGNNVQLRIPGSTGIPLDAVLQKPSR